MPLGRPRLRWEYNIKMDLKAIRWRGVDWMYLVRYMGKRLAVVIIAVKFLVL
jgi:hypothetical protein